MKQRSKPKNKSKPNIKVKVKAKVKSKSIKKVKEKNKPIQTKKIKNKQEESEEVYEEKEDSREDIKHFLDFKHIEELYMNVKLLNEKQSRDFIAHHKSSSSNKAISRIISEAKDKEDLVNKVKEELVLALKKEYDELYQKISSMRKRGIDLLVEELRLMTIPNKIRLFKATNEKKDYFTIKKIFEQIEKDLPKEKVE